MLETGAKKNSPKPGKWLLERGFGMIVQERSKRLETLELSKSHLRPLSRDEVRALDEHAAVELGLPTMVLMENAGRGAARVLSWAMSETGLTNQAEPLPLVVVVCGPGNNGGDGAVLARHLDGAGLARVHVVWTTPPGELRGDAPAQYRILQASGVEQSRVFDPVELESITRQADWVVDGLFGTGLTRPLLPGDLAGDVVRVINQSGKPVLALDIPSGMDADTGDVAGVAIQARLTATFVAPKHGFFAPGASQWTGRVEIVDIGLPRQLLRRFEA